jgi:HD-GYP domain-containing protein (c-di-GMP phosphodiesterase class II)
VQITVSLGVATLEPGDDLDDVVRRADRALYAAKDAGRDRVMSGGDAEDLVALDVDPAVVAVLERVADIIDRRLSPDEHSSAVARWSAQVADELGLPAQQRLEVAMAGRLHDIGKIDIPDSVLQKRDPLDPEEWALLRTHPAVGADMLLGVVPAAVADLVRSHHERYDGTGYPHPLAGQEIPMGARIIAVTDSYAAMTVRRHYSEPKTPEEARAELIRCSGTQFDPVVVTAFLALLASGAILPTCPLRTAEYRGYANNRVAG